MKHFISISLMCISIFFLQTIFSADQKAPFEFSKLEAQCSDVANEIIVHAWNNLDNRESLLSKIMYLKIDDVEVTNKIDQNKYTFHGIKIPIYFYTLEKGSRTIKTVGYCLNNAQPSNNSTLLFIPDDYKHPASLTYNNGEKHLNPEITSACMSVLGDIALTWQDTNNKEYLSIIPLKTIEKSQVDYFMSKERLDITKGAEKILDKPDSKHSVKTLFTLDGSQLCRCYSKIENSSTIYRPRYTNINSTNRLTIDEKAKRLGIPTVAAKNLAAKKLLQEKRKKK